MTVYLPIKNRNTSYPSTKLMLTFNIYTDKTTPVFLSGLLTLTNFIYQDKFIKTRQLQFSSIYRDMTPSRQFHRDSKFFFNCRYRQKPLLRLSTPMKNELKIYSHQYKIDYCYRHIYHKIVA
jgi:hypothetical protein